MTPSQLASLNQMTVEELITSCSPNYDETIEILEKGIKKNNQNEPDLEALLVKVSRAKARIKKPLQPAEKFKCLVFPFGMSNSFTPDDLADIARFKKYGYVRKTKDWYTYSMVGAIMYLLGGILIGLLLKY